MKKKNNFDENNKEKFTEIDKLNYYKFCDEILEYYDFDCFDE